MNIRAYVAGAVTKHKDIRTGMLVMVVVVLSCTLLTEVVWDVRLSRWVSSSKHRKLLARRHSETSQRT